MAVLLLPRLLGKVLSRKGVHILGLSLENQMRVISHETPKLGMLGEILLMRHRQGSLGVNSISFKFPLVHPQTAVTFRSLNSDSNSMFVKSTSVAGPV